MREEVQRLRTRQDAQREAHADGFAGADRTEPQPFAEQGAAVDRDVVAVERAVDRFGVGGNGDS